MDSKQHDPFVNSKGYRFRVRICPECWEQDGWDEESGWCYWCGTTKRPVWGSVYLDDVVLDETG